MPDADLSQQRINRPDLDTRTATMIAKFSGVDVVPSIRDNQRQSCESFDDLLACARTRKSLQQFLKYQPGGNDRFAASKCRSQCKDGGSVRVAVAAKGEGPNARVD